jgi:hypothetical protein
LKRRKQRGRAVRVLGIVPFFVLVALAALVAVGVVSLLVLFDRQRGKAREAGYSSLSTYLRAAPRTDAEKRDAADLALKGLVLCLLGLLFPPLLLFGLFPFFYGARKVVYASMGLGLADDADQPTR